MPESTYRLVTRPSGVRNYHLERRGVEIAECDNEADAAFLEHILNHVSHDLIIEALVTAVDAHERSAT